MAAWEAVDREPTPQEAVALADLLENVMRGLSEHEQQILQLRLEGYTVAEVSEQVGFSERSVHRVLSQLRRQILAFQQPE